jgi:UDP:flavonoid glycosyltransferase YjiC (YdhE family)
MIIVSRMLAQLRKILYVAITLIVAEAVLQVNAGKILIVVYPQPSHVIAKLGIAADLIRQGHEVHIALPAEYPHKEAVRRVGVQIVLYKQFPGVAYPFTAEYEQQMNDLIYNRQRHEFEMLWPACGDICRSLMEDTEAMTRLKEANYSLVLVEPFGVNPCFLVVPHYLGVPFVSVTAIIVPFAFRLPALPSFYPAHHQGPDLIEFPSMRTLRERITNTLMTAFMMVVLVPTLWSDTSLLQQYAPGVDSWEQLMLKSEILLVENDYLLDKVMPLLPHVVTIAGCSAQPAKPLPESIEKIMAQSGDDGVILASFGTSAYRMPSNIATKFLEAFGRLRQTVLTKMAVPPGVTVS